MESHYLDHDPSKMSQIMTMDHGYGPWSKSCRLDHDHGPNHAFLVSWSHEFTAVKYAIYFNRSPGEAIVREWLIPKTGVNRSCLG